MAWTIEYTTTARRHLRKLDKPSARKILDFMDARIAKRRQVRSTGKPLSGPVGTLWRYRIGDFRIICDIQDNVVTILVLRMGHRKHINR